jgi:hypothetical protein
MEGKKSHMTIPNSALESLVSWNGTVPAWDERLKELADYRKIHGHLMSPTTTVKTPNWGIGSETKEQLQVAPEGKTRL